MKTIIFFTILLVAFLQYKLWFSGDGVPEAWQLKKQMNAQMNKNQMLQMRNSELDAEVNDLKKGHDALEERARMELGMIKNDEAFYQLVTPKNKAQQHP